MRVEAALARQRAAPRDLNAALDLAEAALDEQREAEIAPLIEIAAENGRTEPLLWQWTGLLYRGADNRLAALSALEKAAALAPLDPLIAHSVARVHLEAGFPSALLFEHAMRISPGNGEVILGWAAALLADGKGQTAIAELDQILMRNPLWLEGHRDLIQLRTILDGSNGAMAALERAIAEHPLNAALRQAQLDWLIGSERFDAGLEVIRHATKVGLESVDLMIAETIACSETGAVDQADKLYWELARRNVASGSVHHVRHLLRNGRIEQALILIEQGIKGSEAVTFWPYASAAWRLAGDARASWLDGEGALVSVVDLADRLPPIEPLAATVRRLHQAQHPHFDQSVRGGTQSDGALFSRVEPEIIALRKVVVEAVEEYIARQPPFDRHHPTLSARRTAVPRFSGSWSVRLAGGGHHANHVHPAGWISSALYIDLPPAQGQSGWLTLGEPQASLNLGLQPTRLIEPKRGRLVLFPSTLWHGTLPFEQGERLTVAFDVQRPLD